MPNADPARGLLAFTLKPEGMKGEELLAHLCKLRNRAATSAAVGVSAHLNVDMTDTQRSIIQPAPGHRLAVGFYRARVESRRVGSQVAAAPDEHLG